MVTTMAGLLSVRWVLGGGALLDVGIYPVSLAHWLAGKPQGVRAEAEIGGTGVDYASSYEFDYGDGVVGRLDAAIRRPHKPDALITGNSLLVTANVGIAPPRERRRRTPVRSGRDALR